MENQKNMSVQEFLTTIPSRNKDLPDSLTFHSTFTANGKQGMVGLLEYQGEQHVYKISQYLNYLPEHEGTIMESLNKINGFCPHFCKTLGRFSVDIDPKFRKLKNPFEISGKYPINTKVLMMEYLRNTRKLYRYIKKKDMDEDIIYSLIQQTLCALLAAQENCRFTHYDLHSNNIMIRECDPHQVSVYRVSEDKAFIIPTYGFVPVIIDYGFSYCQELDGKPVWPSLAHTDVGFMSNTYDKWSDFKLFLLTTSYEMENYHRKGTGRTFRKMIKNIFKPLSVDTESGWDTDDEVGATEYAITLFEEDIKSPFFEECIHFCTDILQTLTNLPLTPHNYDDISLSYKIVEEEFLKIENEIKSKFYLLYIFKEIVASARLLSSKYFNIALRQDAIKEFRHNIYEILEKVSKYARPKLNYEKLLCGLLLLGRQITGVLHDVCREKTKSKNKEYKKLSVKEPVEILEKVHKEFGFDWEADEQTYLQVYDFVEKKTYRIDIDDEEWRETFNNSSNEERVQMVLSI